MRTATVYLIHFDRPYKHAKHYLGYTALESLEQRLDRHRSGRGAKLLRAVQAAGISWTVTRTWNGLTPRHARTLERRLKGHSSTRYCPLCDWRR